MKTQFLPFEGDIVPAWDRFNLGSPTGTIFTSSSWLTVIGGSSGVSIAIALHESDGQWICGLPVAIRAKGPFRTAMPLRASPYFGFVLSTSLGHRVPQNTVDQAVAPLMSELLKHANYVEIPNRPGLAMSVPLGFDVEERKTYVRDLAESDRTARPDKEVRYELRRAEHNDLQVGPGDPSGFLDVLQSAFRNKGLNAPVTRPEFMELYRKFRPGGGLSIYLARRRDEVAAGAAILRDTHSYYYWLAATNPTFRSKGASYLLLHEILRDLKRNGPPELDLVGANVPSVAKFKSHFASKTQSYLVLKGFSSSYARLARMAYQRVRGVKAA